MRKKKQILILVMPLGMKYKDKMARNPIYMIIEEKLTASE